MAIYLNIFSKLIIDCFILCVFLVSTASAKCLFPAHYQGNFYASDQGTELWTVINPYTLTNSLITANCSDISVFNDSTDTVNWNGNILVFSPIANCFKCYQMYHRTVNIIQYKQSNCITQGSTRDVSLTAVCSEIVPNMDLITMFRRQPQNVNCKTTWEGTFHFTYEVDQGGGGICNSPGNAIVACQDPGSPYVDNQVFWMYYGKCAAVTSSANTNTKFQCMGAWTDKTGNMYSGLIDNSKDVDKERYKCMLTRSDQQLADNSRFYTMSRWADCSSLKSPYDGPIRIRMEPAYIGALGAVVYGSDLVVPSCNFPRNFTGTWFTTGEFDSDVTINSTHIHMKTTLDQYSYRETVFACQQNRDSRYLVTAVTIGRCEVDYVCFDFMPRHHNIIRWRMSRPYRLTKSEKSKPNYLENKFRQACWWSSFTLNRLDVAWTYQTFILNPPAPVPCPIGGRYSFMQYGIPEERYVTRIRGMTPRPRHQIDCREFVSEFKSCDESPKKIYVDAEYCATLDHTGKPIGEYDQPDRELNCVGYWLEDMRSYMITYDMEDAVSPFRCWVYERQDWRDMVASRAIRSACGRNQTAFSKTAAEGASLSLVLKESERLFDQCPQRYDTGRDPYTKLLQIYVLDGAEGARASALTVILLAAVVVRLFRQ